MQVCDAEPRQGLFLDAVQVGNPRVSFSLNEEVDTGVASEVACLGLDPGKRGLCPEEPSQINSSSPHPRWLQGRRKWVGREGKTDPCQMHHVNHQLLSVAIKLFYWLI